jgi:hypothetical protein
VGLGLRTGTMAAGHGRGAAVGEEDAQPDDRVEDRRSDGQAGQRRRAEVTDDRGVGQHHQGLTDQREKCWDRDPKDLPISRRQADRGHGWRLWTSVRATRE